jgi:hypothetical protein
MGDDERGRIGWEGPPCLLLMGFDPSRVAKPAPKSGPKLADIFAPRIEPSRVGAFEHVCAICRVKFRSDNRWQKTCSYSHGQDLKKRRREEEITEVRDSEVQRINRAR